MSGQQHRRTMPNDRNPGWENNNNSNCCYCHPPPSKSPHRSSYCTYAVRSRLVHDQKYWQFCGWMFVDYMYIWYILGDFAVLIKSGMSIRQAICYNLVSAVLSYIGMVIGIMVGNYSDDGKQFALAITAGLFLYVALANMVRIFQTLYTSFNIAHRIDKVRLKLLSECKESCCTCRCS